MTYVEAAGGPFLLVTRLVLTVLGACVAIIVAPSLPILVASLVGGLAAVSTARRMAPEDVAVRLALATSLAAAHPLALLAGADVAGLRPALLAPAALAGAWALARLAARGTTVIDITDATLERARARTAAGEDDEWVDPPTRAPRISRRPVRDPWHTVGS